MVLLNMGSGNVQQQKQEETYQSKAIQDNDTPIYLQETQRNKHQRKRKRHHRRHKAAKDPQQAKEVKLQKIKMKREAQWNTQFIKESIPDIFVGKSKKRKRSLIRINPSPLRLLSSKKEKVLLPEVNRKKLFQYIPNANKSFKIRQIKKESHPVRQEPLNHQLVTVYQHKVSHQARNKQRLLIKLQEKVKLFPINKRYRGLLQDVIQRAIQKRHKSTRKMLQTQIDSIGSINCSYTHLEKLVEERRRMIKSLRQQMNLKALLDFQIHSLSLIQQILKFKTFWEGVYEDSFHLNRKVKFYYLEENYLAQISKQVAEISKNDPFLVQKTQKFRRQIAEDPNEQQYRRQVMLKIRACELLFLQEEFISSLQA